MGSAETVVGIDIVGEIVNYTPVDGRRFTPAPLHGQGDGLLGVLPPEPYLLLFLVQH
jgi:hypothetical protein